MSNKKNRPMITVSIEHASIIRKFTIFFLLMSVLPMAVLFYFYMQIKNTGRLEISYWDFNLTLTFVVLGIMLGYFSMRAILTNLVKLTDANRKVLEGVLTPEKVRELSFEQNEVAVLAQTFSAITEKLQENVKSLELARRTLQSIMDKVGQGISNMDNIDAFLELILETVTEAMGGQIGVLLLADNEQKEIWIENIYGALMAKGKKVRFNLQKQTPFSQVAESRNVLVFTELAGEVEELKAHRHIFKVPFICTPLLSKDKVIGFITVSGRVSDEIEPNERMLLFNLAVQTAVAIENARLNQDAEKTYFETISALALAVDARDAYSRGHLDRVAEFSHGIAEKLGLDEDEKKMLREAARLHDLGKIGIPDDILSKRGPLLDQEYEFMKKHVEIGESIIKPIHSLRSLCDIIRHHHEKLNGSGYPDGLMGDEISLLVRITTVADIYDALITDRPYRVRFPKKEVFKMLREMVNKGELDSNIVETLIETQGGTYGGN